ncbi:MAG: glycosyltransferase family 4 protein [Acidimicrobiales bacterium]
MAAIGMSVICGTSIDEQARSLVHEGARPRIDVLEMERRLGARLYEFSRLQRPGAGGTGPRSAVRLAQRSGQWSIALALDALEHIRDDDAVFVTGEDAGFALAWLMELHRISRPALVVRLEEMTYGRSIWKRTAFGLYRQNAMRRIDRLACRTDAILQYLHAVERVPMEKLALVGETVDQKFFAPELAASSASPSPPCPSSSYILSAGMERRDYPTLIAAASGLPIAVVIAAGSPWSHGRFEAWEPDRMPGNVSVSSFDAWNMRALYESAELVVVPVRPSLRACGMNVVLEGWSMQKAVIATRTVGLASWVTHGVDGLLVEPYEPESLRSAITGLLADPGRAAALAEQGHAVVENDLNIDRYVDRIGAILEGAADERRHRRR